MINEQLINPQSIVIIGGSDDITKPGGKILFHILEYYRGEVFIVNQHREIVQGCSAYKNVKDISDAIDLAILAIPAQFCLENVQQLIAQNHTRAFIIISAGFSEVSKEGAHIEKEITAAINAVNGCLIGPNCTGIITHKHPSYFTTPIPPLHEQGLDFISSSGATAVFVIENALQMGLRFNSIFSVGNAPQTSIEDILEFMDENYHNDHCSQNKLLYIEDIKDPDKLLKHSASLINKGCKIAAIKAGTSEAGQKAAQSHTGAMSSSDVAVDALFEKAGIIRCHSRLELVTMGALFSCKELLGSKIAVITHAGGPAVMLTDTISHYKLEVPTLSGKHADNLKTQLYPGASTANPIDFLATGTDEQLKTIIDYCENKFNEVDAMVVIFGSSGLFPVDEVYEVLHHKIKTCQKPIYAVLPSVENAVNEISYFTGMGNVCFFDEVIFGNALGKLSARKRQIHLSVQTKGVQIPEIRKILSTHKDSLHKITEQLLEASGINIVRQQTITSMDDMDNIVPEFPLVAKVIGPIHKTEIDGVALHIKSLDELKKQCARLLKLEGCSGVSIQPMLKGIELFIGAKYEPRFGHMIMIGVGGIFVEVINDISTGLAPLNITEALDMIQKLKAYPILKGYRNQPGIDIDEFANIIVRFSTMLRFAKEITEMDLNPLIATPQGIFVVDASIHIE